MNGVRKDDHCVEILSSSRGCSLLAIDFAVWGIVGTRAMDYIMDSSLDIGRHASYLLSTEKVDGSECNTKVDDAQS